MNREIKYQCWDKKRKRMYEVLHLHIDSTMGQGAWATVRGYDVIEQKDIHLQIQPENAVIREFTGLHDKNGKEIYEGDVVKYKDATIDTVAVVGFMDGAFTVEYSEKAILHTTYPYVEVIGNIHEHPHLIS